jgi:hypothetical protein
MGSFIDRPREVRSDGRERTMRATLARSISLAAIPLLATPTAVSAASSTHQRHCIAQAVAQDTNEKPSVRCYQTFGAAISAATKGRVTLKNATTARAVSSAELAAGSESPLTVYVLSIDYQNASFGGSTFTWTQSSPCGYYQAGSMPSGWNDVVSSVADYSGCATTLYWNSNFGSPIYAIGVNASVANLGTFNDKTSSQKWCPAYPCS